MYTLIDVTIAHTAPQGTVQIVEGLDLSIAEGSFTALEGPSGSGKTSLIDVLAGFSTPVSGRVVFAGQDISSTTSSERAQMRLTSIGLMFQDFNLLAHLTALQNVCLPLWLAGRDARTSRDRASMLLDSLGLAHRSSHTPDRLSGGERQRVALARALALQPQVVLADEPTGNLDAEATSSVGALLEEVHSQGHTVIVATHDPEIARLADTRVRLGQGRPQIVTNTSRSHTSNHQPCHGQT